MALTSTQHLTDLGVSIPSMGGGDNTWYQVAQWVTGGIVVALVIGLGFGVFLFVKGKFFGGSADSKKNGLVIGGLSLAGAIVMGTTAAAISWSGRDGGSLAAMFPDDAAPGQTVSAERQSPLVSCDSATSVQANNRGNTVNMHPTPAEHSNMSDILEHNDVLEQLKVALVEEGSTVDSREELDENWGEEIRIGVVEWNPANADRGCNADNTEARAGSTIHVDVWFDSGWLNEYYFVAGYVDRDVTVSDN